MRPNTPVSWLVRILLVFALAISACMPQFAGQVGRTAQAPEETRLRGAQGSQVDSIPVGRSNATTIVGRVEAPEIRTIAALATEVASGSTITLIDTQYNTPAAVTKTDAAGNFSLALAGFTPRTNVPYVLEAVKDLGSNKPGSDAARLRTIILWNGTDWLSISNSVGTGVILISNLTTAVAIISALDPVGLPPANSIGKVTTSTTPASLNANPAYPAHSNTEINAMAADLTNFLTADHDPVAAVGSIAPVITGLSPATVQANYLIAIDGRGFSPRVGDNAVTLGALACTVLAARGDQIVAQVPSNAVSGDLKVVTARGTSNLQAVTIVLAVVPMPVITGVSQLETVTGKKLTIFGQNFRSPATVTFTTSTGTVVAVPSSTEANSLVVTVPASAVAGNVTVTTPAGTTNKVYFSLVVVSPSLPTILGASDVTATGKPLTLYGQNFVAPATVTFTTSTGTVAAVPTTTDANSIVVAIPASAVTGNVTVTTAVGTSNRVYLTITGPLAPVVSAVSQLETVVGKTLTIFGQNFTSAATVTFTTASGTTTATPTSAETNSLVVAIPATAVAGYVTVTTVVGTSNKVFLSLVAASSLLPTIQGVSGLETAAGKTITFFGENFTSGSTVKFTTASGTTTVVPTSAEANSVTATVPASVAAGPVTITTAAGTSNKVYLSLLTGSSTVVPIILGATPLETTAGRTVTIFGQNFTSAATVNFTTTSGTTAVVPTSAEVNSILVVVPTTAAPGAVTVTTAQGTSNKVYLVINPKVTTLSVASGLTGAALTINGSGFGSGATVKIGGVAQTVTSSSNTAITVTIADATQTGAVVVTTSFESATGPTFSVLPKITSINPTSGYPGTPITVSGTGFHDSVPTSPGGVYLDTLAGAVETWSNTKIVFVPDAASLGAKNLTVKTAYGTSNGKTYTITYAANHSHYPWDNLGRMTVGNGYGGRAVLRESAAGNNSFSSIFSTPQMSGRKTWDIKGNLWAGGMTSGNVVTRYNAGGGTNSTSFNSGAFGLAVDQNGNAYVGTWSSGNLYKIDATSFAVSVISGTSNYVSGIAVDINGDVYWTGPRNGTIMKWTKSNSSTSTLNSNIPGSVVVGLAFGPDGTLYASPAYSRYIFTINKSTGQATQWVDFGAAAGNCSSCNIHSIAVQDDGDVYVGAHTGPGAVLYRITPSKQISLQNTFPGNGNSGSTGLEF